MEGPLPACGQAVQPTPVLIPQGQGDISRTGKKHVSTGRSDEDIRRRLRYSARQGLDLDLTAAVASLPSFRALCDDPAALVGKVAAGLKSSSGASIDFGGDVSDSVPRKAWPQALQALRVIFEAIVGEQVTAPDAIVDSATLQRLALEATQGQPKKRGRKRKQQSASVAEGCVLVQANASTCAGTGTPASSEVLSRPPSGNVEGVCLVTRLASDPIATARGQEWACLSQCPEAMGAFRNACILAAGEAAASGDTRLAGSRLGLAFLVCDVGGDGECLRGFAEAEGNMISAFADDAGRLAQFVTVSPQALPAVSLWQSQHKEQLHLLRQQRLHQQQQPQQPQQPSALVQAVAAALDSVGDSLPATKLADTLGPQGDSAQGLATRLRDLAKCNHRDTERAPRLRALAAVIATAREGAAVEALRAVGVSRFNLLSALDSDHLARTMASGDVEWASLQGWVAASAQSSVAFGGQATNGAAPHAQVAASVSPSSLPPAPAVAVFPPPFPFPPPTVGPTPLTNNGEEGHGSVTPPSAPAITAAEHPSMPLERARPSAGCADFQSPHKRHKRTEETVAEECYADLRARIPPEDPKLLEAAWPARKASPVSPTGALLKFDPGMPSLREGRWAFWRALSQVGIFVKPYYAFTAWVDKSTGRPVNASPGVGSAGQEVVKSPFGTILWMTTTHRLYSPNGGAELLDRLRCVFPQYNTVHDALPFHGGRLPHQFQQQLAGFQPAGFWG